MKIPFNNLLVGFGLVMLTILLFDATSFACTTIIAGKNTTNDGSVLLGHNEDNGGICNTLHWYVPRMKHEGNEYVQLRRGGKVPQVPETYAYIWSENVGLEWSDGGINEKGVALGSNWAGSRVQSEEAELTDGGIGYMLRHIILQRASTAREGVEIAAKLLDEFGYAHPGRSYQIADSNEGWVLHAMRGKHYVAMRVPDDQVYFIPNVYVIHDVDFNDTKNFIASKGLKEYAIEKGWYDEKEPFDFAKVFADPESRTAKSNTYRQWGAHYLLTGKNPVFLEGEWKLPTTVKPNRKLGLEDMADILRFHYENTELDENPGYEKGTPHSVGVRKICVATTNTSFIAQLRSGMPKEIGNIYWLATGSPCTGVYVPWYLGILEIPHQWQVAQETPLNTKRSFLDYHFDPAPEVLQFNDASAYYTFTELENLVGMNYKEEIDWVRSEWKKTERQNIERQPYLEKMLLEMYNADPDLAIQFLTDYSKRISTEVFVRAKDMIHTLKTKYMSH